MIIRAVMPTRNQAQYILEAIHSIDTQVDNLVVVDDASTDDTVRLVEHEMTMIPTDLTLITDHEEQKGTAEAINTGVRELFDRDAPSSSWWLTWVSSDNVHLPTWREALERVVTSDTGVVYSSYWWNAWAKNKRRMSTPYTPERLITDINCYFGPSFIIRSDVWAEAGDHRGVISHDYDHWLRIEEVCWRKELEIKHVDITLCNYRVHSERRTTTEKHTFDAPYWQGEARGRRSSCKTLR